MYSYCTRNVRYGAQSKMSTREWLNRKHITFFLKVQIDCLSIAELLG